VQHPGSRSIALDHDVEGGIVEIPAETFDS
jgi:hypothetical protein